MDAIPTSKYRVRKLAKVMVLIVTVVGFFLNNFDGTVTLVGSSYITDGSCDTRQ
jgi:hypothetical protein